MKFRVEITILGHSLNPKEVEESLAIMKSFKIERVTILTGLEYDSFIEVDKSTVVVENMKTIINFYLDKGVKTATEVGNSIISEIELILNNSEADLMLSVIDVENINTFI
jgi:hypothetical protein